MAATALTNTGRGLITARLSATSGITATLAPYMGFGTSATAVASATSTALGTELTSGTWSGYTRSTVTGTQVTTTVTNDTYQAAGTLTASGQSAAITEAGNFDASSAGNLMLYATFAAINLSGTDSLAIQLRLQFS
jgi:hypothetical protein